MNQILAWRKVFQMRKNRPQALLSPLTTANKTKTIKKNNDSVISFSEIVRN
jgi:hypothetical protein